MERLLIPAGAAEVMFEEVRGSHPEFCIGYILSQHPAFSDEELEKSM